MRGFLSNVYWREEQTVKGKAVSSCNDEIVVTDFPCRFLSFFVDF